MDAALELARKKVQIERVGGGSVAATYGSGKLRLNIGVAHIWENPLGEETLGLIIHECAHDKVSGHAVAFQRELERLGGKLARWVGVDASRWSRIQETVSASQVAEAAS